MLKRQGVGIMDRKIIYDAWQKTTYKGQGGENTPFCEKLTLQKFDQVSDHNFGHYVDYQNDYIDVQRKSILSFTRIRSEILEFLLSDGISNLPLEAVTSEILDTYMLKRKEGATRQTFTNRISFLAGFFEFLRSKGINTTTFDSDKYRQWAESCPAPKENALKPLTPKNISEIRQKLIDGADEYPRYREYLYVLDMLYYTDYEKSQIKNLSFSENVRCETMTIVIDGREAQVPQEVIDNIEHLHKSGVLGKLLRIDQYIKYMKPIFEQLDFDNIRIKDIEESKKTLSFCCPQCHRPFEATIENWCARQYTPNGKLWIVCRECGDA